MVSPLLICFSPEAVKLRRCADLSNNWILSKLFCEPSREEICPCLQTRSDSNQPAQYQSPAGVLNVMVMTFCRQRTTKRRLIYAFVARTNRHTVDLVTIVKSILPYPFSLSILNRKSILIELKRFCDSKDRSFAILTDTIYII